MSKEEILKLIERLPDEAREPDVMEALYFRLQVDKVLKDAAGGRRIAHPPDEGSSGSRTEVGWTLAAAASIRWTSDGDSLRAVRTLSRILSLWIPHFFTTGARHRTQSQSGP